MSEDESNNMTDEIKIETGKTEITPELRRSPPKEAEHLARVEGEDNSDIYFSRDAYVLMFQDLKEKGSVEESAGLFVGRKNINPDTGKAWTEITQYVPLPTELTPRDQARVTITADAQSYVWTNFIDQTGDSTLEVVGWAHTHPKWGVFLSTHDDGVNEHFDQPHHVAVVYDPSIKDESQAVGIFSKGGAATSQELGRREVEFGHGFRMHRGVYLYDEEAPIPHEEVETPAVEDVTESETTATPEPDAPPVTPEPETPPAAQEPETPPDPEAEPVDDTETIQPESIGILAARQKLIDAYEKAGNKTVKLEGEKVPKLYDRQTKEAIDRVFDNLETDGQDVNVMNIVRLLHGGSELEATSDVYLDSGTRLSAQRRRDLEKRTHQELLNLRAVNFLLNPPDGVKVDGVPNDLREKLNEFITVQRHSIQLGGELHSADLGKRRKGLTGELKKLHDKREKLYKDLLKQDKLLSEVKVTYEQPEKWKISEAERGLYRRKATSAEETPSPQDVKGSNVAMMEKYGMKFWKSYVDSKTYGEGAVDRDLPFSKDIDKFMKKEGATKVTYVEYVQPGEGELGSSEWRYVIHGSKEDPKAIRVMKWENDKWVEDPGMPKPESTQVQGEEFRPAEKKVELEDEFTIENLDGMFGESGKVSTELDSGESFYVELDNPWMVKFTERSLEEPIKHPDGVQVKISKVEVSEQSEQNRVPGQVELTFNATAKKNRKIFGREIGGLDHDLNGKMTLVNSPDNWGVVLVPNASTEPGVQRIITNPENMLGKDMGSFLFSQLGTDGLNDRYVRYLKEKLGDKAKDLKFTITDDGKLRIDFIAQPKPTEESAPPPEPEPAPEDGKKTLNNAPEGVYWYTESIVQGQEPWNYKYYVNNNTIYEQRIDKNGEPVEGLAPKALEGRYYTEQAVRNRVTEYLDDIAKKNPDTEIIRNRIKLGAEKKAGIAATEALAAAGPAPTPTPEIPAPTTTAPEPPVEESKETESGSESETANPTTSTEKQKEYAGLIEKIEGMVKMELYTENPDEVSIRFYGPAYEALKKVYTDESELAKEVLIMIDQAKKAADKIHDEQGVDKEEAFGIAVREKIIPEYIGLEDALRQEAEKELVRQVEEQEKRGNAGGEVKPDESKMLSNLLQLLESEIAEETEKAGDEAPQETVAEEPQTELSSEVETTIDVSPEEEREVLSPQEYDPTGEYPHGVDYYEVWESVTPNNKEGEEKIVNKFAYYLVGKDLYRLEVNEKGSQIERSHDPLQIKGEYDEASAKTKIKELVEKAKGEAAGRTETPFILYKEQSTTTETQPEEQLESTVDITSETGEEIKPEDVRPGALYYELVHASGKSGEVDNHTLYYWNGKKLMHEVVDITGKTIFPKLTPAESDADSLERVKELIDEDVKGSLRGLKIERNVQIEKGEEIEPKEEASDTGKSDEEESELGEREKQLITEFYSFVDKLGEKLEGKEPSLKDVYGALGISYDKETETLVNGVDERTEDLNELWKDDEVLDSVSGGSLSEEKQKKIEELVLIQLEGLRELNSALDEKVPKAEGDFDTLSPEYKAYAGIDVMLTQAEEEIRNYLDAGQYTQALDTVRQYKGTLMGRLFFYSRL